MTRLAWEKKGRIFVPDGRYEWMQSYAQCPTVLVLEDRLRIYFSCRPRPDSRGRYAAVTSFLEVARDDPGRVLSVHDRPILPLGGLGAFDQFGLMPGCVLRVRREVWLYYVGWMRCEGVPYDASIGLAVSADEGVTFRRAGRGPVFGRTLTEPFLHGSAYVVVREGVFHAWYVCGTDWIEVDGRAEPLYVIAHATSPDGLTWRGDGRPCLPEKVDQECQASPTLLERGGRFHMWFSYRWGTDFRQASRGYRIGYAWSSDLETWHREDEAGTLDPSPEGWDSEMVCYPCVVEVGDRVYLFYSGNHFGRDGFGYAELRSADALRMDRA
jgi:hypothetical protein